MLGDRPTWNSEEHPVRSANLVKLKQEIRQQAYLRRQEQRDKDRLSHVIVGSALALRSVRMAETLMFYLDVRDEVRTRHALPDAFDGGSRIVVPWCSDSGDLELFHLESMSELVPGKFGILEPSPDLRLVPQKHISVSELDAVFVPGVAFDSRGGRLGHGRAYYDRLLSNARADCHFVGLAWECQMFPEIPMGTHDVFMDSVVTERAKYDCGDGHRTDKSTGK